MKERASLIKWGWQFVHPFWVQTFLYSCFPLVSGLLQTVEPRFSAGLIDSLAAKDSLSFKKYLAFIIGFQALSLVLNLISRFIRFRIDKKVNIFAEGRLFDRTIGYRMPYDTGTIISLYKQDLSTVISTYQNLIPSFVIAIVVILVVSVILIYTSLVLFFTVIATSILPLMISNHFGKKLAASNKRQKTIQDKYNGFLSETNEGLYDIQDQEARKLFKGNFVSILTDSFDELFRYVKIQMKSSAAISLCSMSAMVILYSVLGVLVFGGDATIGSLVSAMMYAGILSSRIQSVTSSYQNLQVSLVSFSRLKDYFEDDAQPVAVRIGNGAEKGLVLEDFSYSYNGQDLVFKNLDYKFDYPGFYLIKGANGSGKSTLLYSLASIISGRHATGRIILNGFSLSDIHCSSQYSSIFSISVRDNLCMGHAYSDFDIFRMLKCFWLDSVITSLPKGMDEMLSTEKTALSAGQIQKILLCRAFLKEKPILLLDEIDSSFDDAGKDMLMELLKMLSEKTLVLMANHHDKYDSLAKGILCLDDKKGVANAAYS